MILVFIFVFTVYSQPHLPVIRVYYNETKDCSFVNLWKKFAPSLTHDKFTLKFGGGDTFEHLFFIGNDTNEVVLIGIEQSRFPDYYLENQKPFVRLVGSDHISSLSVSLVPPKSYLFTNVINLLKKKDFKDTIILSQPQLPSHFDSVIVTDLSNETLNLLLSSEVDKDVPVFIFFGIYASADTDYFVKQLQQRKYTFIIAPTVSRDHTYRLSQDYVPYQAFLFDAMLVASHGIQSQSNISLSPLSVYERLISTQYNGMSGLFSFNMNGERDKFLFSVYEIQPKSQLNRLGFIDQNGYEIINESLLPSKNLKMKRIILIVFGATFVVAICIVCVLIISMFVKKASSKIIAIKDIAFTLPPLFSNDHAKTYYGMWRLKKVCVKVLTQPHNSNQIAESIYQLKKVKNEHIIKIFGGNINPELIVMEYAERESLLDAVQRYDPYIQIKDVQHKIIGQTLQGLSFLHKKNVLHLNLTPSNVLLTEKYDVKLSDMDGSLFSHDRRQEVANWKKRKIRYCPPELLNELDLDETTDVYMWAMNIFYLTTTVHPFQEISNKGKLIHAINSGTRPISTLINDRSIEECVEMCWKNAKENRPSIDELHQYSQFTQFVSPLPNF
ncbi:serine-threonine protein kinase, putative [Entamoeba histolytica HM-3:IMSS]|uniref:Protein kinase domain containing protein n=6 Tax=Entamoeba histolytica TaxID=5759 RepID=C4LYF5_ENTH1|nr:protein kinase domain containing protein [Entamoeba histolytica HM-1:IMSS]EAL48975.1 protein kinase domain containing protein [Entamoeba histolytica HM-1:IMSS]EMD48961.1 serine/threonine protein kinase, putative [Entamoeba histolytica KU27]EMS16922.1 serine-threonine protein kinase, putative [Entamoeba histolytica HM-3:IMSS]GAT93851.1 protein kinase domain containing protein [Entamoeba histolytica]|eukprot:XP_654361.1 protein kinase domain containing protein [Entamoeba histolytica HM-1:IMSS]